MLAALLRYTSLALWLVVSPALDAGGVIGSELDALLVGGFDEPLPVIIGFADEVDVRSLEVQGLVKDAGARDIVVLWIVNGIAATASAASIQNLRSLPGVTSIRLDAVVRAPDSETGSAR